MTLHDQMYDAVADVSADLHMLATAARARGLAVRRRRRALATVGTTAAALVAVGAVGGVLALRPDAAGPRFASSASPTAAGATAPNTGRTTAAALAAAVDQVADGSFSDYAGQSPYRGRESYAEFLFAPASGGPAGLVEVNVQSLSIIGAGPYDCTASYLRDCKIAKLSNGDTLRTYTDADSSSAHKYRRLVAELLSPRRHLRVVVGATNTGSSDKQVVREDPVLSIAQLSEVATQPWWGFKLPAAYARAGHQLPSYDDLGSGVAAATSPSPSSS